MIFGFNTDVIRGGTVYHVQSEARQNELLLQTQVFVRGRCIGKRATSYAELFAQPGFTDQRMHEMLKSQHRSLLEAIRDGRLDTVLGAQGPVQDVGGEGLGLELLSASPDASGAVVMRFLVTDQGSGVAGAQLTARLAGRESEHANAVTAANGGAALTVFWGQQALRDAGVLVHATFKGKSATRKFRLRKS